MEDAPPTSLSLLATITVSYNPDPKQLQQQLEVLPDEAPKFLIDNNSIDRSFLPELKRKINNIHIIENQYNEGLASAINRGAQAAHHFDPELQYFMLLDQDTTPHTGSIENLTSAFEKLEAAGEKVGGVGPLLYDRATGLNHGFHQLLGWRYKRHYPQAGDRKPVSCIGLNGSGTLVRVDTFLHLGGLNEDLFIDHVDTEWSFRLLAHGYSLWGVPTALFDHQMGDASIRFWFFGWHIWPKRSPFRHYYLFRNTTTLLRKNYIPIIWKIWAVIKLKITILIYLTLSDCRSGHLKAIFRGICDAIRQ